MKKILFGSIIILALTGAGCNSATSDQNTNSKSAGDQTSGLTTTTNPTISEGVTLNAEVIGNQTVNLTWQVSDELKKEATGYGITLGDEANPTYPGRYWYTRGPAHFELSWTKLPLGVHHLRVCVMKDNACTVYSNDVEVDIK